MRRALASDFAAVDGCRVKMTLDSRFANESGPWETIRVGPRDEARRFRELAATSDLCLILAPETELHLLDRSAYVEEVGGRLMSCRPEAIRLAGSKYAFGRVLESNGVATPPTYWRGQEDRLVDDLRLHFHPADEPPTAPNTHPLPAVLKSNHGAGSLHTYLIDRLDAIPPEADGDILQPFIRGEPRSASFLVGADGHAHLVGVGRQRMRASEGVFHYEGGVLPIGPPEVDPDVRRAVELVADARGWVGVDFVHDPATGRPSVLEINPRVTTSYVGLRQLLPPGELARAWLALIDDPDGGAAVTLAGRVHAQAPVRFDADGSIRPEPDRP